MRAAVVTVDSPKQRFTVALKHSLTGAADAAYARSLFADLEAAERIRCGQLRLLHLTWRPV